MQWTLGKMEVFGKQLIAEVQVPDGTDFTAYAELDPGRIMFVARQQGHAGATAVTRNALEDSGADQARIALDELLRVVRVGGLPKCPDSRQAPLLGYQTSSGWRRD